MAREQVGRRWNLDPERPHWVISGSQFFSFGRTWRNVHLYVYLDGGNEMLPLVYAWDGLEFL